MKLNIKILLLCLILTSSLYVFAHENDEGVNTCQEQDYIALRALYLSTDGDNWNNNTNWLTADEFMANPTIPTGTDVSTWLGVEINMEGCVTRLLLNSNNLVGNIPPEIGNLINLESLSLGAIFSTGNQLSGSIPSEIGNLINLTSLIFNNNDLSGNIPPEIGNLINLTSLYLGGNEFSGSIPTELGNLINLTTLNLGDNQLSGSIPSEIGNLIDLFDLNLGDNQLSGSLPAEIGNLTKLWRCWLSRNQLSGSLPPEIGNLSDLETLSIFDNQLSGSLPPEVGNLTNLTSLNLRDNQVSGSIPPEIGNLSNLRFLELYNNQLSGNIPAEMGNLTNLERLFLYSNQLTGGIPPEFANLNSLIQLVIHSNQLSGCYDTNLNILCSQLTIDNNSTNISNGNNFDAMWGSFCSGGAGVCVFCQENDYTNLRTLYLNTNGDNWTNNTGWFTAAEFAANPTMPTDTDMGTWYGVTINTVNVEGCVTGLMLSDNNLVGSIPAELENLSRLENLHLDNNQLSGSIPAELGNLGDLISLNLSTNQLSGTIPAELGKLSNLTALSLHANQLIGDIPVELGDLSSLTSLILANNQFSGNIPVQLGDLNNLSNLNLSNNQLSGNIPAQLEGLSSLTNLNLSTNQLSGNIPPQLGNLNNLSNLTLNTNQLSGCYEGLVILCTQLTNGTNNNISDGNNFDADWEDYCATGVGACSTCPTGNIFFDSQQAIDNFAANYPMCTEIEGNMTVSSPSITDLTPLSNLTSVTEDVTIYANSNLNTLSGLENIDTIGGNAIIGTPVLLSYIPEPGNPNLTDLSGLEGLRYIGGDLEIINNDNLQTINGLSSLNAIEGSLIIGRMFNHEPHLYADVNTFYILGNNNLADLNGLENLSHVGENVEIIANPALSNLQGLGGLSKINGHFIFYANHSVTNFSGLNLTSIGGDFVLHREKYLCEWNDSANEYECTHNHYGNDALINFEGLENLTAINGSFIVAHNNDLLNFEGLNNLSTIGGDLWIGHQTTLYRIGNDKLTSLSGLENLNSIDGQFSVIENTALTSLDGLPNLDHTGITELNLIENTNLSICNVPFVCAHLANNGLHTIQNNASGCNTLGEVEEACLDVLPVEMTDPLSVYLDGRVVILRWRTGTETNNAGFEVQRSKDGINWEKIAWQNGQGTITTSHRYTQRDPNPLSGTSYYRLKQVDFDENFEYSNIVSLHYHKPERINVYPIPTKDFVVFDVPNIVAADEIILYDITGKEISRQAFPQDKKLVVNHLNDGVYIYRIFYDNEIYSGRIVVE